jgi:hypothetical protein
MTTQFSFDLTACNPLSHGPLQLVHTAIPVHIALKAGENHFLSTPTEIGTFHTFKVFGQLSIPYRYDPEDNIITICGPDDNSDKQMALITSLDQHPAMVSSHVCAPSTPPSTTNMWADFVHNTPALQAAKQAAIRHIMDDFVAKLLENGITGVIQTGPAPVVTPQNYADYKAMFAPKKPDVEHPTLDDIADVQTIVCSTYYGTTTWNLNTAFANVIGSTHDPKPSGYSSWINLWATTCNNGYYTTHCSSYNYEDGHTPFSCNTDDFVGGHVILGKTAKSVATGGTVYIFPICKRHNGNDNIYMSMRYNPKGVVLTNYNT